MPKTEIRKLLKQQRSERQKEKRVEHPFAKYDAQDQLICVVCQSQVKSVWSAHLTSAYHKENMARLRSLKQQKQQQQQKRPVKRTSSPVPEETSVKRAKHHETHNVDEIEQDEEMENDNDTSQQLPADFFDNASSKQHISDEEEDDDEEEEDIKEEQFKPSSQPKKQEQKKPQQQQQQGRGAGSNLPQGFFDDPEEEARIRNKAPIAEQVENILDEEYSLFKEAMADTIIESEKVDEEEDEELWLDRDEEMFRQQAEFDSRVENLKKMRVQGMSAMPKERENRVDYDDGDMERELKNGLKKGVRNVLKKAPSEKITTVFDDMDISSDEEEEEEDWRAQQL